MDSSAPIIALGRCAPTIPVSDIDRALQFYLRVLGMNKVFENGSPVGFVILKGGGAEIHLTKVSGHRGANHNVMHLMVDDATALYDRVIASGVKIVKGIRDAEFGLKCFVMSDPDGNRIDVGQVNE